MTKTIALIAATAASLIATAVPAAAQTRGAFDPVTLTHQAGSGQFCIRSGWGMAGTYANRLIRRGDCHDVQGWRQRGVAIDASEVELALRTKAVRLAAR